MNSSTDNKILVTGWSGLLGRKLIHELESKKIDFFIAGRKEPADINLRKCWRYFDLTKPSSIDESLRGINLIIHLASSTSKLNAKADVEGTRKMLKAIQQKSFKHFIYVSVVGVDKVPMKYYKLKRQVELDIINSKLNYTIFRATQFHPYLAKQILSFLRFPIAFIPKEILFQPIQTESVAKKLIGLVAASPKNQIIEIGGPEKLSMEEAAKLLMEAKEKRKLMINLPLFFLGRSGKLLKEGALTTGTIDHEGLSWKEWLKNSF